MQFDAFGTMIFRAEKSVMRNTNLRSLQLRVEKNHFALQKRTSGIWSAPNCSPCLPDAKLLECQPSTANSTSRWMQLNRAAQLRGTQKGATAEIKTPHLSACHYQRSRSS
jgi:hypothetical protein